MTLKDQSAPMIGRGSAIAEAPADLTGMRNGFLRGHAFKFEGGMAPAG